MFCPERFSHASDIRKRELLYLILMSLIEVHECLEECMKRFRVSKLTFLLAPLLALALMTAQVASAASLDDEWSIVKSPNGSLPQNTLNGIAAISRDDVWAVGDGQCLSDSCSKTLIEHWNGSQWSIVQIPNRGSGDFFNAVAAVSAHDVWAGGAYFTTSHPNRTLIEHCC
jgi:hypothetical protein